MSMTKHSQVAKRYAEALFATIVASDHAPASISEEIQQVISILEDSKIHSVFHHPKTAKKRKGELVKLMNVSPITESFLLLVVEKSREGLLPSVAYHFEQLVLEAQQTTIAEIVSAIPLATETLENLTGRLQKLTNKTVRLETKIDPSIGGGLIIKVDGKVIDGSISHTLKQFRQSLVN